MIGAPAQPRGILTAFDTQRRTGRFRLLRGPMDQPAWVRPSLIALLIGVAVLYLWGLGSSGTANDFYAAAVLAGTKSWKAFFFGSFDSSNFITVDKPPASLWVMEISSRIFGFSSWSMLVPQALEGVGAVALVYAAVRRWSGPVTGLLAAIGLAVTPVAALMFRFNNPDALLALLLVAAAYAVVRAIEQSSARWLMLGGVFLGFGFLTKMLEAVIVLPVFAIVYLACAPGPVRRRLLHVAAAGAALLVSAGWWVAAVTLIPAADRPYIGGSTDNSVLQLVFGYNGLSRLTGGSAGAGGANFSGTPGILRLFNSEMGAQVAWLIPAALIGLVSGLWATRREPRQDRTRAALLLWGGWSVLMGAVFSLMSGVVHPYYTVALAPGLAAVVAVAARRLWSGRQTWFARCSLAAMVLATGVTSVVLLDRATGWFPVLQWVVIVATGVAVVGLLTPPTRWRRTVLVAVVAAGVACLSGPSAYAIETAATPHTGSLPSAGPASATSSTIGGGFGFGGRNTLGTAAPADFGFGPAAGPPGGAGAGGNSATSVSSAVTKLLQATTTRWALATVGAQSAAGYELASGKAVMAIGGFTGSDPAPTLAQFKAYVSSGQIRYFIAGGAVGGGGPGGSGTSTASAISTWVTAHFKTVSVGGQTLYDLTQPANGG